MSEVIDPNVLLYARIAHSLHEKWNPHNGQVRVGAALFRDNYRSVFVQCGRKWGKTELIIYMLWRWGMTYPNSPCYYIAPYLSQAKEILWADPRIQTFGPKEWVDDINNTEMRVRFKNGSFIKVDGSDNYEKHRGTRPAIVVYEEFKDHRPEFREVMRPNLAVYNAPEIFIGTPPDRECEYLNVAEEHRLDDNKFYYEAPTDENPHIPPKWLAEEKERLYRRDEGDVWEREYRARYVKGGVSKIFPMLEDKTRVPHADLVKEIFKDRKKIEWVLWADPGTATCFAVLFLCVNPFTKKIYILDEIYETNQSNMSVRQIGARIFQKREELYDRPTNWRQGYDEAATWWANEMIDNFEEYFEPSRKSENDKEVGISIIKDIMLNNRIVFSDRCVKLFWEMDNYYKDRNGKIPKKNDHLIDCLRYSLGALNYQLNEQIEAFETDDPDFRGSRLMDDFNEAKDGSVIDKINLEDW